MQKQPETQHENEQPAEGHDEALYAALRQAEEKQNSRYQKARAYFSQWHNVATTLTLLFVGAYTVLTLFLLTNAQQQVGISRDTEIRQLRAYMFVTRASLQVGLDNSVSAAVVAKNFGLTPALKFTYWACVGIRKTSDQHPNLRTDALNALVNHFRADPSGRFKSLEFAPESVVPPGDERVKQTALFCDDLPYVNRPLTASERSEIEAGESILYLYGEMLYVDVFGIDRYTRYRLYETHPKELQRGTLGEAAEGNDAN